MFFLIVQTSAIIGSAAFGIMADHFGQKRTLTVTLLLWLGITVVAYFIETRTAFFILGIFAGVALGSSQSTSRSFFALITPEEKKTEFFGFYSFFGKASAIIGPALFGFFSSGSYCSSVSPIRSSACRLRLHSNPICPNHESDAEFPVAILFNFEYHRCGSAPRILCNLRDLQSFFFIPLRSREFFVMKQTVFTTALLILASAVSTVIYYYFLPDYIRDGGPIVILLLALSIMVITFIIERTLSLRKAEGRGSLQLFLQHVVDTVKEKKFDEAIEHCRKQQGVCANVLQSALERYLVIRKKNVPMEKQIAEVKRVIEEATALETPLLEKNLIAISTIASIATMVGLFGTTLGMIRSFRALASTGAPDAVQLSLGISEALINTAGGLFAAIMAIVAYNVFVNKVDNLNYMLDEAVFEIVEILSGEETD